MLRRWTTMFRKYITFAATGALALLIVLGSTTACGGKTDGETGSTNTGGDPNQPPSVAMTATPARVNPGEPSTIRWSSSRATSVRDSNFGADTVNGTIQVQPTVDTTFTIEVQNDHGRRSASTTVEVNQSAEQYILVGAADDPQVPQVRDLLQSLTTTPVAIQPDIPNPGGSYAAVVIHVSGSYGAGDAARVKAILDAGKGVVVIGRSARKLATGDVNEWDISPIASWLGGATYLSSFDGGSRLTSASGLVYIPRPFYGRDVEGSPHAENIGPSSSIVAGDYSNSAAFAYRPSTGGRLYFQSSAYTTDGPEGPTAVVFKSGCRWAASGI